VDALRANTHIRAALLCQAEPTREMGRTAKNDSTIR